MTFGADIDTLNLLLDKLRYIFSGYNTIRESFLEMNDLYKQGQVPDKEFFEKLHESINGFSALEFLSIKAVFEIKKSLDRTTGSSSSRTTQIPSFDMASQGHSLASFITTGNPTGWESSVLRPQAESNVCVHCGALAKKIAKFCANCGKKLQ